MEMTKLTAEKDRAIADKQMALNEFLALLQNSTNRDLAQLSADTSRYVANASASAQRYASDNALKSAQTSAAAQRYSADSSRSAQRYAQDMETQRIRIQQAFKTGHPENAVEAIYATLNSMNKGNNIFNSAAGYDYGNTFKDTVELLKSLYGLTEAQARQYLAWEDMKTGRYNR